MPDNNDTNDTNTNTSTNTGGNTNTGGTDGSTNQSQSNSSGSTSGGSTNTDTQNQGGNTQGTQQTGGTDTSKSGQTDGKTDDKTVAATWPADWRQQMAGEDKALLGQLERFTSPMDLAKKIREQDKLISSGQLKQPLPKDATPEQLAAFRKENGIPETADKYDLTMPDGLVIGEKDKPIVDNMVQKMHLLNLPPDAVKELVTTYFQNEKAYTNQLETTRNEHHTKMEDTLRAEWGPEYRSEINRIEGLLNTYSAATQQALQFGTDENGMRFLDNPAVMRDLALQARMLNPVTTITPAGGGNQMASAETEIAAIEKEMGGTKDQRDAYFKDEKKQARYRELIDWRERQNEKSGTKKSA